MFEGDAISERHKFSRRQQQKLITSSALRCDYSLRKSISFCSCLAMRNFMAWKKLMHSKNVLRHGGAKTEFFDVAPENCTTICSVLKLYFSF
jgi:hypothetical protein